jgi:hypothetical protein
VGRNSEEQKGINLLAKNSLCLFSKIKRKTNILVAIAAMLCISIRTVLVCNYSRDTGCSDKDFVALLSPSRHVPEQYFDQVTTNLF